MKRTFLIALALSLVVPFAAPSMTTPASGEATIYRDEYGIPHVFAETLESASFAVGYAQAEDRLEELLKNYRKANGTMSEVFGPDYYRADLIQRMWRHSEVSREKYNQVSPKMRACIEAFQDGIKVYMKEHPDQVPKWAQEIHPWDVIALGRYIIWGWPLGEAGGDLQRGGIQPDPAAYRGSNEMLIAPGRTSMNAPIAVIDPHLSWYGEFRFYQIRIYAGDYNVSGVSILGIPFPALGHSRYCSVAMTTGGPDTSDIYEEELNPANPRQYRYDGQWRGIKVLKEKIGVKKGDAIDWREVEIEYTHHGPIVAHKAGKAYSMAIPYAGEIGLTDQSYEMMMAKNLDEMKRALSHLQLMSQNVMVGTVQGDIYYLRNGRVPIRAKGIDPSKPVAGNTSATEWQGIHPMSDLVQITNPSSGYMHNCNVSPFGMMKDSPLVPEKYIPYVYNATRTAPRHQRAEMMTELLDAAHKVTLDQALDIAFSPQVYHAELWQARLKQAWSKTDVGGPSTSSISADRSNGKPGLTAEATEVFDLIQKWNRRSDAESEGALAYYAFKKALDPALARQVEVPSDITDAQLLAAVQKASEWLKANFGSLRASYGRYFRVGRLGGDRTFPVSGGSLNGGANNVGMATPRAISFGAVGKEMVGAGGQTSTQIVVLTNPPKSYAIIPLGESDHKESGHWDDQAEKLFSKSKAAPTYFMDRRELIKHITATKVLKRTAAAAAGK
ncbi:MAG TPA: penicillin acylase family protein [Blastocatellia bacterium]|nr:penicillin acylase family protein [Blastocatellia bacterium]